MFLFHLILLPKKPLFFPFHQCFPPRSVFPYNNRVILIMGDFRVCFGNSEISHWENTPLEKPLRPQVRRSGRQCILTLAGEQFAVCSLKTGVAWCTQEKTKETPFLGTEEDMKSPPWQIAGNIHHMTQWRNTSIKLAKAFSKNGYIDLKVSCFMHFMPL